VDPEERYPNVGDRMGQFLSPRVTASLQASAAQQNAAARSSAGRPQSVLSQIGLSPLAQNATAPDVANRYNSFTGTVLPNVMTGSSESTAETALKLRFAGQEGV
jgi:hypothetical protein